MAMSSSELTRRIQEANNIYLSRNGEYKYSFNNVKILSNKTYGKKS
jgi:hypothetical protein